MAGVLVPFSLRLTPPVRLMLLTVGDDETYADLEVQWVRDRSGAEGLVLLAVRRDTGTADVCVQAGLDIPRADYEIGTGLARFESVPFERARFDVTPRGAQVDLAVVLLDGRMLRLEVMESRRTPRPLVRMLAPAGQAMTDPHFFPFFWMDDIWFLRWRDAAVRVEVDGRARRVARMGMPWRLARYAVHPLTGLLCAQQDGPLPSVPDIEGEHTLDGSVVHTVAGPAIAAITAARGDQTLAVTFDPPVPDLAVLPRGSSAGRFHLHASHRRQLGGAWTSASDGGSVRLTLQVDQLWDPGPQPAAARAVFTALAVFRTWPTSYRWEATVARDADPPWMTSRWTRV